ncbi:MAG: DUF3078 domain-containing protein [Bacteroidia bacterium]
MKKITPLLIALAFATIQTNAQTTATADTSWKTGGIIGITFNQVSLTNWAAGGDNSIALNSIFTGFANYKKGKWGWDNGLILAYGMVQIAKEDLRKNDDRIELVSKPGYEFKKNWCISYLFNFRSQFSKGYDYNFDPRVLTSDFLAPAYIINSLGIEYKPNDNFYFYVSPVTLKTTYINVGNDVIPHLLYGVDSDKTARNEFGFYLSTRYKKDIMTNVTLFTKLDLFSNYSENPQNVDVNCELLLSLKVNKFITATVGLQAIYDDDTFVPKGKDDNGVPEYGKGLQFKESIGVGLAYNFGKAELEKK